MADDLSSEFDYSEELEKKKRRLDLSVVSKNGKGKRDDKASCSQEWHKEDRKQQFLAVDPYSRHKLLINEYLLYYPGSTKKLTRDTSRDRTDLDVIRENSKFLWSESEEPSTWEAKLAKRYYDKLFKEYCVVDLSRYKENKIALRWRIQQEVVSGKGLCPDCSYKLNYHNKKHKVVKRKRSGTKVIKTEIESDTELVKDKSDQISSIKVETEPVISANETELWKKPVEVDEEKSREEEFEEFLDDLFV